MLALPSPIHVALLSGVFAILAFVLTLAQRLGDWRSKKVAQVLGAISVLVLVSWLYLAFLWIFNVDLRASFSWRAPTLWVLAGAGLLAGVAIAIMKSNWFWIEKRATEEAIIEGPHLVDLEVRNHSEKTRTPGLIVRANNRRDNDTVVSVLVREVKSLNRSTRTYRENSGSLPRGRGIITNAKIKAASQSDSQWLIRVLSDHMEVGNTTGDGKLDWPPLDKSVTQRWKIGLAMKVNGFPDWNLEFDIIWPRGSNTIGIIRKYFLWCPVVGERC